jgi:hypothetical protein
MFVDVSAAVYGPSLPTALLLARYDGALAAALGGARARARALSALAFGGAALALLVVFALPAALTQITGVPSSSHEAGDDADDAAIPYFPPPARSLVLGAALVVGVCSGAACGVFYAALAQARLRRPPLPLAKTRA